MNVLGKRGKRVILLGNEAIVRGALEAGVDFVSTYPGTPASEVGDTFYKIRNEKYLSGESSRIEKIKNSFYFEYSTNEKVALEAGAGASFCGLRSLVAMKHFGLNVASDFFIPLVNSGVKGPLVILVADDPSCHSSAQSEQDSRAYSHLAHIPTLEPSDPQECKDFTELAFKISERFKIPVMIRTTTRVAHQSAPVELLKIKTKKLETGKFEKNFEKFVTMPPRVLEMKKELFKKIDRVRKLSEKSKINRVITYRSPITNRHKLGIITSGVSYLYVVEVLRELELEIPVLKLSFFYPLPEEKMKEFIENLKKVLIVEELEPYLEKEVERLAKEVNPRLEIYGKNSLPRVGELRPEYVIEAIAEVSDIKLASNFRKHLKKFKKLKTKKHIPRLCPGCPYWLVFSAVKRAVDSKKVIFGGEIGCYMLAGLPPHEIQDYLYCMGSSVGIGHGIKKSTNRKLITFVGDSSFFHAGIPALINTVYNKSNPLILIMDNRITAMTGQQPHPGTGKTGMGERVEEIKIEEIVRGCGVKNVKVIDPVNQKEMIDTIKEFMEKKEVSVIVARRPCLRIKT